MSWANKIRQDRPAAPQDYCAAGVLEDRASDTDGALCASGFLADQNEALDAVEVMLPAPEAAPVRWESW